MRDHLDLTKLKLETKLDSVQGNHVSSDKKQELRRLGFDVIDNPIGCKPMLHEQHLKARSHAGGKHCDCCKKSEQELGLYELEKCSRCKLSFYCSKECQRKAWYAGHKQACRKKGQIEIGDDMLLGGLSTRQDLNGRFVKVVGMGKSEGKWLVKLCDVPQPVSVLGDKLVRLRPAV